MPRPIPVLVTVSAAAPPSPAPAPTTPSPTKLLPAPATPVLAARAATLAAPAAAAPAAAGAGPEAWRWRLSRGDAVEIQSKTAGGWVTGRVVKMDRDRLQVEYIVRGELCDKVLLYTSRDLRPAGASPAPLPAPAQLPAPAPLPAPVGYPAAATSPAVVPASPQRPVAAASPLASSPATPVQVQRQVSSARPTSRPTSCSASRAQRRWVEVEVASVTPTSVRTPPATASRTPAVSPAPTPGRSPLATASPTPVATSAATPPAPATPSAPSRPCLRVSSGEWLRVADLEMGEILGSGGFGSVHRGRLHGEEVAVKRLHLASSGQISKEHLAEFQKEVANLQALRHPRLIRFVGVALELPVMCIITELAAGGSLYALIHVQRMPLSEAHRRDLVLQICEGVAFLHGRRPPFVHRDLKSANVVLDAELNAKLCDFGLAETMDKTHMSRREAEAGSPRYMAPEVFDARGKLTEKLDVWALGCLIVEVLIDQVPHEDCSTVHQVAAKLLVKNLGPFEDEWADGLRPEVRQLVGACFSREASQRPAAAALLEGLRRLEGLALPRAALAPGAAAPPQDAAAGHAVPPTMQLVHCVR